MRTYRGIREPLCHVRVIEDAADGTPPPPPAVTTAAIGAWRGVEHELAVPRELIAHVLVPFDWGIDGPGTHYLAVALLAELLGAAERPGIKAALPFMRRFLSHLPKDDFEISETVFRALLHAVGLPPNSMPLNDTRTESADGAAKHQPISHPEQAGS